MEELWLVHAGLFHFYTRLYCENRLFLVSSTYMSQIRLIKLKSTKSPHVIWTRKNKKTVERKIEVTKFDPTLRQRVIFKEAKK